jgi:hypothetical protein
MVLVEESAETLSPTAMPTDATVPAIGLVNCASASDCCALTSAASAVSIWAWSESSCAAVGVDVPPDVPVAVGDVLEWVALEELEPPVLADDVDEEVDPSAVASAASSFATVFWSAWTFC